MKTAASPLKAVPKRSSVIVEHARVRLREDLPKYGLAAGTIGTVVHLYRGGEGMEVEFAGASNTPEILTLRSAAVELLDQT